jgi:HD-GYP domain-containing protein (c-di-GMP phosphodiesterase class II)/membrane protein implicated in regulation of membrane protease activity
MVSGKVLSMSKQEESSRPSIIEEIRAKLRLLNLIAAFVVFILLAVIIRFLFKPVSEALDFLPDISITLIIVIVLILSIAGFIMWYALSKKIIRSIEKYRERLNTIFTVTKDIREETYGDILLDKIISHGISLTQSNAGFVVLKDGGNFVFRIVKGPARDTLIGSPFPKDTGIAGWVLKTGQRLNVLNVKEDKRFDASVDALSGDGTTSVLSVPLSAKKSVIGVIELSRQQGNYSDKDAELIGYLADQAASSLVQTQFYEDQKNYEIHITDILLKAIDAHIPDKRGHSHRVAKYSNIVAKAINMPEEKKKRLYLASLLHDLGFLRIKAEEMLTREDCIKHALYGYEMVQPINFYADIAPFILHHHERYDGSGYPAKLQGEGIPLEARIIAIAEAFDAMTSGSYYKAPIKLDKAVGELEENAGTQFDAFLVQKFIKNILTDSSQ